MLFCYYIFSGFAQTDGGPARCEPLKSCCRTGGSGGWRGQVATCTLPGGDGGDGGAAAAAAVAAAAAHPLFSPGGVPCRGKNPGQNVDFIDLSVK